MTPDRFRKIEELYHAAREATPEERAALLAQTDPELRREVELLLQVPSGGDFLNRPAVQNAPELMEDSTVTRVAADTVLGPYRIESKLGEGGMGEVFRAVDTRLGRPVAIKFAHAKFNARFEREARAIASLNHPHICTLYDIGPNYLVMELLDGETIAARLKNGPLPVDEAVRYASQIAAALSEAHARGIVHRDLKPGNIMLVKSGVKVLDFGLATWEGDETITGSNMVIGTPAYMAPEQRLGKPSDVRTDIYSFGCILYEMLSGERPAAERKPLPSKSLERIVSRCLEADPARRWQSSVELAGALEAPAQGKEKRSWLIPATILAVALSGIAIGSYLFFHPRPKLTDKDIVVLADFVNNTGEPIFDGTLRQGLAIELERSPFLKTMEDGQMQGVLRRMSLPRGTRITNQIAHEVCVRERAAATIDGAITSLGKNYAIALQAISCQDGVTLAREQLQAEDKEHVLATLATVASAMRVKLGESRASMQNLDRPQDQDRATTPSLEALQIYMEGRAKMPQGQFLAAVSRFQQAINIDPNFTTAYYFLSVAYDTAGEAARSRECASKAWALIDRVSDYEREHIAAFYYSHSTGELDKAISELQEAMRKYPRSWSAPNVLSEIYIDLGRYEEGLQAGLTAGQLEPNAEPPNRRQLDAYICLGKLGEAKAMAEKLRAKGLGGARVHQRFLEMAYVDEDQAAIGRELQWFAGKPEEFLSLGLQAAERNVHGKRRDSHRLFEQAAEIARRQGLPAVASDLEDADAQADALLDNCQTAHKLGRPVLALAICGEAEPVQKMVAENSKTFPNGTVWNAVQLPEIKAALALKRGQPAESVADLEPAKAYERAHLGPVYLRGRAYLKQEKGLEAAGEFQKIVDQKGVNWAAGWRYPYQAQFYSLSYLGLARAYKLEKDIAKAKKAYQAFFALWKDPDTDIQMYKAAKAEYAKLN